MLGVQGGEGRVVERRGAGVREQLGGAHQGLQVAGDEEGQQGQAQAQGRHHGCEGDGRRGGAHGRAEGGGWGGEKWWWREIDSSWLGGSLGGCSLGCRRGGTEGRRRTDAPSEEGGAASARGGGGWKWGSGGGSHRGTNHADQSVPPLGADRAGIFAASHHLALPHLSLPLPVLPRPCPLRRCRSPPLPSSSVCPTRRVSRQLEDEGRFDEDADRHRARGDAGHLHQAVRREGPHDDHGLDPDPRVP